MNRRKVLRILGAAAAAGWVLLIAGLACAPEVVRTANPPARGLTEAHFTRVKRLADGVYS